MLDEHGARSLLEDLACRPLQHAEVPSQRSVIFLVPQYLLDRPPPQWREFPQLPSFMRVWNPLSLEIQETYDPAAQGIHLCHIFSYAGAAQYFGSDPVERLRTSAAHPLRQEKSKFVKNGNLYTCSTELGSVLADCTEPSAPSYLLLAERPVSVERV